jgi:glycosyltransferase involved in cell wall biosynthesis
MRVLMLTEQLDIEDRQYSGFAHDWISELAGRVERLHVICQKTGRVELPANVQVTAVWEGHSVSKLGMIPAYQRAIWSSIHEVDIVFVHRNPHYVWLVAPLAKLFGVPIVEWKAFGQAEIAQRVAHLLANRIVTPSLESYTLSGDKISVIGHGIDFERFAPPTDQDGVSSDGRVVVSVGRLASIKDVATQIDAAALLLERPGFEDVIFQVAGEEVYWEPGHRAELEARITSLGLEDRFYLVGGVPYTAMNRFYQAGTIAMSTSRTGSLDKVVLEAIGCGLPVIVTSQVYEPLLGEHESILLAQQGNAQDLANKLEYLLAMMSDDLKLLGLVLRERAVKEHGLSTLIDRLADVFEQVVR